jgi:AcrR family transcriptional regulator
MDDDVDTAVLLDRRREDGRRLAPRDVGKDDARGHGRLRLGAADRGDLRARVIQPPDDGVSEAARPTDDKGSATDKGQCWWVRHEVPLDDVSRPIARSHLRLGPPPRRGSSPERQPGSSRSRCFIGRSANERYTGCVTRAEQAQRTRQAVLDTARHLFADRGFAGTSLQDIADAMGVRKANVYYYFKTKAAILDALLDERVSGLDALLAVAESEASLEARRELIVVGFAEEVVRAYRTVAPIDFADPAVRSVPGVAERLEAFTARASRALFGRHPTVDQLAGLAVMHDLKPVMRALDRLSDDELVQALQRLCRRLIA